VLLAVPTENAQWAVRPGVRSGPRPGTDQENLPMALFMYQAAYTLSRWRRGSREPQDRIETVRPALEAMDGKIIAGGHPFGEYDVLVLFEASDEPMAAAERPGRLRPPGCSMARYGSGLLI
jgi:hypothetical protein